VSVTGKYNGGTVGAYGNYIHGGFILTGVVKVDLLGFDWQAPVLGLATTAGVDTVGARVEAAYKHLVIGRSGWLEPFGNLTYAKSSWDQFSVLATTFDLNGNESLLGRLGMRVGSDVGGGPVALKVYAGVGVAYEFDELNTASVVSGGATLPLTHMLDTTALELQGGVKWSDISPGLSLSVNSSGRLSKSSQEYGGKATVNYNF
jgi:outer membrane autotransporter protein